jgi:hypothetical protein
VKGPLALGDWSAKLRERDFNGLTFSDLSFMGNWIDICNSLSILKDICEKRAKSEEDLEMKIVNLSVVDEIELECKIDDYKKVLDEEREN